MSNVWLVLPSKRPPEEALPILHDWLYRGYKVLVQRDPGDSISVANIERPYAGYAEAVNHLVRFVLESDPEAAWIVAAGDDMLPDPHKGPEEIARECQTEFYNKLELTYPPDRGAWAYAPSGIWPAKPTWEYWGLFGVMQPTGDTFGANPNYPDPKLRGPYCTRVAGSPWMGREFCRRMYGGRGPLCDQYFHMGEDEELMAVAIKYGVFWQRPDLEHRHMHWGRPRAGEKMAPNSRMPEFLRKANSQEEWQKYKKLFAEREAAGFPGSDPTP